MNWLLPNYVWGKKGTKASKLSFYENSPFEFPYEPKCTTPEGFSAGLTLCDFVLFGVVVGLHLG